MENPHDFVKMNFQINVWMWNVNMVLGVSEVNVCVHNIVQATTVQYVLMTARLIPMNVKWGARWVTQHYYDDRIVFMIMLEISGYGIQLNIAKWHGSLE